MSGFEEETYSTIFTSLKHPVRRKILRMLSGKPRNFSEMPEALGISSSHLTYHLENLGELVSKTENGKYRLSTFGEAAVGTMRKVEEMPKVTEPKRLPSLPIKWKSFFVVLMGGLVVLAGVSYIQYQSLNRISTELNQISAEYEQLSVEYEKLNRLYDELYQIYLSTIALTTISTPIPKSQAIHIALEYGGWNKTTLKDMVVTAHLKYSKFFNSTKEISYERLYDVTEPVSDYSPVRIGDFTYRYVWVVGIRPLYEFVNNMFSIPPSGLYFVDAATGEVICLPFLLGIGFQAFR